MKIVIQVDEECCQFWSQLQEEIGSKNVERLLTESLLETTEFIKAQIRIKMQEQKIENHN